ncbi:hypothetical protein [Lentzea sp. NPDC003310]|uniref:hypothetical protein n=1 Tax=Lentzea sp. NPDC003310 TaxID=3154447 RepID=UPI0033B74D00
MRVAVAAVVGALCAAAWSLSFVPIGEALCYDGPASPIGCLGLTFLWVAPISAVVWALVAWGLLRLARFTPAWPTAAVGVLGSFVLALAAGLTAIGMKLRPSADDLVLAVTISAGAGYALAAALTAGYRGRRDGAEHRGQDG